MRPIEQRRDKLETIFRKNQKTIIYSQLADCFLQDSDESLVERAVAISEIGIKNHPEDANGHFVLGKCYHKMGDPRSARSELERVLKYFPSHLGAIELLIELNSNDGLEQVNQNLKEKLIALDPLNKIGDSISPSISPIDFSNIDSDLIGITRPLSRDCIVKEFPEKGVVKSTPNTYPTCKSFTDQTRVTHPAWMYRDLEQTRWYPLFLNPQENTCIPFHNNLNTRILEKDNYVPKYPCPVLK